MIQIQIQIQTQHIYRYRKNTMPYKTIQDETTRHNTIYDTTQFNATRLHNTTQHITTQYSTIHTCMHADRQTCRPTDIHVVIRSNLSLRSARWCNLSSRSDSSALIFDMAWQKNGCQRCGYHYAPSVGQLNASDCIHYSHLSLGSLHDIV